MKKSTKEMLQGIAMICVVCGIIIGLPATIIYAVRSCKIDMEMKHQLERWTVKYKGNDTFKNAVKDSLLDGKITIAEYDDIRNIVNDICTEESYSTIVEELEK